MEYNLKSIRDQVLIDKLDDDTFDPEVVNRYINTVQRRIFNTFELPFMEQPFSGVLPAEQRIFGFPSDVQVVQKVVVTAPDGYQMDITDKRMRYQDFSTKFPTPANNQPGRIEAWTLYGGKMYTSRPTDVAYQMETFYIKKPTILEADTDVPSIPEEFQELLVLGAFKLVLERNEDYDLAAVIGNQYNDLLDLMVARYGYRMTGGPIKMAQPNRRTVARGW